MYEKFSGSVIKSCKVRRAKIHYSQRNNNPIAQLDAYWPLNPAPAWNPIISLARKNQPANFPWMRRDGGNEHQSLYVRKIDAKNAAKSVLNLTANETNHSFTRIKNYGDESAQGIYTFYPCSDNSYKVLVNHTADPTARLERSDGVVIDTCNHYHAGTISVHQAMVVDNLLDANYTRVPGSQEHYFSIEQ